MIKFSDVLMYVRYYKKVIYLNCLKNFKQLDYIGRMEDSNPLFRGYEGCYPIKKLLKMLNITSQDRVIDIGCGKGLFLYYASMFNFNTIDGIERSYSLTKVAKHNAKLLKDERIHIYHKDAREFDNYKNYNYFFINNPFSAEIMENVMLKIIDSYALKKRKIIILYQFPFNIETFTKNNFKIMYDKFPNCILTFG